MNAPLEAIHKRCLLTGGGRGSPLKANLVIDKGREGGYKFGKIGRRRLWIAPYRGGGKVKKVLAFSEKKKIVYN